MFVIIGGEFSGKYSGFELYFFDIVNVRYIKVWFNGSFIMVEFGIVEICVYCCVEVIGEFVDIFLNEVGIDLLDWYLSIFIDEDGNGRLDMILEFELVNGYIYFEFFYVFEDNGIVMCLFSYGYKILINMNYVWVELREMLCCGDFDIWM